MNRNYWERIAPGYEEEIFDVLRNDKKSLISSAIRRLASRDKTVLDAGCAVGKWIPVLAPRFKKVIAADISSKNLVIAQKTYPSYANVDFLRADFSSPRVKIPKCDVAVCINAILTDSQKKRDIFFDNLHSSIRKGGHLVLVVPSLESWLLTRIIQRKWKIDRKLFEERVSGKVAIRRYRNIQEGNAEIDSVFTKHYLCEELYLLLQQKGFSVADCRKIEYEWTTEFVKPPGWLSRPRPWDWLIIAKKGK
jgi:SAM-dependent methyltransferase